jgi:hypothetical protein
MNEILVGDYIGTSGTYVTGTYDSYFHGDVCVEIEPAKLERN